eukprot:403343862
MCPYEQSTCGPSTYVINATANSQIISVNNRLFINSFSCQYQVAPPTTAAAGDSVIVKLEQLVNGQVLINQSQNLTVFGTTYSMKIGNQVEVIWPNKAYLTISGTSTVAGQFALSYYYVKKGTSVTGGSTATTVNDQSSSSNDSVLSKNNTLLYIIIAIVVIAFLVILSLVLVCIFRRIRSKQITPEEAEDELKKLKSKTIGEDPEEGQSFRQESGQQETLQQLDPEKAYMMDEYYNRTNNHNPIKDNQNSGIDTPNQLKKKYFQSDYEDMEDGPMGSGKPSNMSLSKVRAPKIKTDYKSDKESTTMAAGSRLIATDTEGMPSVLGSNQKLNYKERHIKESNLLPPIQDKNRRILEEFYEESIRKNNPKYKHQNLSDDDEDQYNQKQNGKQNRFFQLPPQAMAKTNYQVQPQNSNKQKRDNQQLNYNRQDQDQYQERLKNKKYSNNYEPQNPLNDRDKSRRSKKSSAKSKSRGRNSQAEYTDEELQDEVPSLNTKKISYNQKRDSIDQEKYEQLKRQESYDRYQAQIQDDKPKRRKSRQEETNYDQKAKLPPMGNKKVKVPQIPLNEVFGDITQLEPVNFYKTSSGFHQVVYQNQKEKQSLREIVRAADTTYNQARQYNREQNNSNYENEESQGMSRATSKKKKKKKKKKGIKAQQKQNNFIIEGDNSDDFDKEY